LSIVKDDAARHTTLHDDADDTDQADETDSSDYVITVITHGLRNEVALWRESAPQRLSFTPRGKAVVGRGFPA
jgi:hypothetical protein